MGLNLARLELDFSKWMERLICLKARIFIARLSIRLMVSVSIQFFIYNFSSLSLCLDYECEMHFVSKSAGGKFSVIGIFLQVSNVTESLVGHLLNANATGPTQALPPVNLTPLKNLLDSSHTYWYHGGLTTPPCTEGVKFSIVQKPLPISLHEYASIKSEFNARPTQMNEFVPGCKEAVL
jgi:carbonic anhydrase